jgi:hypothetical protein
MHLPTGKIRDGKFAEQRGNEERVNCNSPLLDREQRAT